MRHPTNAEAKRIQDKGELVVYMEKTVLPLYLWFQGCDFEAKEGAMEYCWHLVRAQMAHLRSLKDIYTPRKPRRSWSAMRRRRSSGTFFE
jgi:hypothetical protein